MKAVVLGAGIAGLSAAFHLQKLGIEALVLEKDSDWGGLCGNFCVGDFRFDKFVHFSFTENNYVRGVFEKETEYFKHFPLAFNYYKGKWLKHPAQNNLYPLDVEEKIKIIKDFMDREDLSIGEIDNLEKWLRVQYGNYFAENFAMDYTEKYWTVPSKSLETKWVGKRMSKPNIEEVLRGAMSTDTPNTYYAREMRYPKFGGFKAFFEHITRAINIT